jgi:4-alpha-glucanotransferase
MKFRRTAGILLHPTSLPGKYGIGDIGPQAHLWIDFLAQAGCGLWQVLPLNPTGYGDSPYQSFSAFAGNPYLISPEALLEDGVLDEEDLDSMPDFPENQVDFGPLITWKLQLLDRAYDRFENLSDQSLKDEMILFRKDNAAWLEDFALFMAIKESQGGISWNQWPAPLRSRKPEALEKAKHTLESAIVRQIFRQWLFFRQWDALRARANEKGIQIIGDIPIFVAHDSADVWANTELFFMDNKGNPKVVAGVPPDYFSPTGQLWGNPLYNWEIHAETGYAWWHERFRAVLRTVDIVRLDHFRGFAAYWEIPAGKPTAEIGQWVPGPGQQFMKKLGEALGELPIIAEDLGLITPDVVEMREAFNLPGMKIFQFGFADDPDDPFLPHNYPVNCVAYTGTHDNDTVVGWYQEAPEGERDFCRRYLQSNGSDVAWKMLHHLWGSVAMFTIAPLQDLLSLGTEARMNFPGRPAGNWSWRMLAEDMNENLVERIKELNYLFSRLQKPAETDEEPVI